MVRAKGVDGVDKTSSASKGEDVRRIYARRGERGRFGHLRERDDSVAPTLYFDQLPFFFSKQRLSHQQIKYNHTVR